MVFIWKLIKQNKGISFIELIVVMGVLLGLFAIATVNVVGIQRRTNLNSTIEQLVSDLRSQQTKTMYGNTSGQPSNQSYGVYLDINKYVLFTGGTYDPNASSNFTVNFPPTTRLQNISPANSIVFSAGSGQTTATTIVLIDEESGFSKTISINALGTVYSVN